MNAIGASILAVLVIVILGAPRQWALLGMMAGILFLTQAQQVQLATINFFALRFLELAGFIRVMSRHEFSFHQLNRMDKALLSLYAYAVTVYLLRAKDGQAYMIGRGLDVFLCYFTFRGLVQNLDDYKNFLKSFVFLLAPYTLLILIESKTHHNPFSILGGMDFGWMRNGRLRCMGSFRNPSLLGTLGATFLPMFIGLGCIRAERGIAVVGAMLCALIVYLSNSGGPLNTAAVGLVAWALWGMRTRMQLVRRLFAGFLVLMALTMKAPIWYLPAKISDITGGDGWHRSYLMDISFQHLSDWWFAGMSLDVTADWFPDGGLASTGDADITNEFLSFGLNSGLLAMILFIILLVRGFSSVGNALSAVRSENHDLEDGAEFLLWGLGAMLLSHIFNWLGITYFDQTYAVWLMQLAIISSVASSCIESQGNRVTAQEHAETEIIEPEAVVQT